MSQQPLQRDLIDIPTSVGEGDFVVRGADLARYVVTDDLRTNFDEALSMVGHATQTGRSIRQALTFGTTYRYALRTKASNGAIGRLAYGQPLEATLFQESTSLARYSGSWTTTSSSSASHGKLRTSTKAGSYVEFKRAAKGKPAGMEVITERVRRLGFTRRP